RRDILVEIDTCLLEKNYIFLMAMKHRFYYDYWKSGDKKIFVDKLFLFMADKEAQEKTIVFNRKINIPLLQNKLPDLCLNHSVMKELKKYSEFTNFKINKEFFQTVDKLVKLKSDFKPTGYDARTVKSIHRYQELTKKMNNKKEFDAFLFNNHLTAYNVKELIDMFKSLIDYGYNHQGIISYVRKLRFTNGIKDSKQAVGLLRDYARMHFSMENKDFKKYPKWLKPAHDLVTNLYNVRTSHQQYDKMISERAYKLVEKYSYYGKYFFITAPANHKEIIEDAIVLDHCGSSYIEEHAKENTTILFVRMNGKEETPLCTLEIDVDNNEILQAVCASNSSPKDELKEFIDDFKKHIKRLNNK
ncbi:MAG: PcfJ domain-containing protein, partial [Paraclostridium sp.]